MEKDARLYNKDGSIKSNFAVIMGMEDTETTKDWPKFDPDPKHCSGAGQAQCLKDGVHSWFNHSQDSFREGSLADNLPPGYREDY